LQTVLAGVHGVLEEAGHGFYLVARRAGEVVGALLITYEWSDWRNGRLWWIQSVYVPPQWRSQGVFRALYQHVNELAQQTPDTRGIRLYVEKDNHTAQAVYQNLGMSQTAYRVFETTF
jgi:ribosomal protein S18 acetylase RimI-like enzyme